jgi:hypothetical protein
LSSEVYIHVSDPCHFVKCNVYTVVLQCHPPITPFSRQLLNKLPEFCDKRALNILYVGVTIFVKKNLALSPPWLLAVWSLAFVTNIVLILSYVYVTVSVCWPVYLFSTLFCFLTALHNSGISTVVPVYPACK